MANLGNCNCSGYLADCSGWYCCGAVKAAGLLHWQSRRRSVTIIKKMIKPYISDKGEMLAAYFMRWPLQFATWWVSIRLALRAGSWHWLWYRGGAIFPTVMGISSKRIYSRCGCGHVRLDLHHRYIFSTWACFHPGTANWPTFLRTGLFASPRVFVRWVTLINFGVALRSVLRLPRAPGISGLVEKRPLSKKALACRRSLSYYQGQICEPSSCNG